MRLFEEARSVAGEVTRDRTVDRVAEVEIDPVFALLSEVVEVGGDARARHFAAGQPRHPRREEGPAGGARRAGGDFLRRSDPRLADSRRGDEARAPATLLRDRVAPHGVAARARLDDERPIGRRAEHAAGKVAGSTARHSAGQARSQASSTCTERYKMYATLATMTEGKTISPLSIRELIDASARCAC
jgi:hypothetical protein